MVHNGIEYADMQLIAETYLILKHVGGLSNKRISEIFHEWNGGELHSYLIGITADIFAEEDEKTGQALVDIIVDRAGQKGTGRWTSIEALTRGVDLSMISAACNARVLSNLTEERTHAGTVIAAPKASAETMDEEFIEAVRRSLYTAKIVAYAQGFSLYRAAKEAFGWSLDFGKIASIFRAGCIIQAEFLQRITDAYEREPNLKNLMFETREACAVSCGSACSTACPFLPFPLPCSTSTPSAVRSSVRTSFRRSATTSGRTPSSARIGRDRSTIRGRSTTRSEGAPIK